MRTLPKRWSGGNSRVRCILCTNEKQVSPNWRIEVNIRFEERGVEQRPRRSSINDCLVWKRWRFRIEKKDVPGLSANRKSSIIPVGRRCIWWIRANVLCNSRSGICERLEALGIRCTRNFESTTKEVSNLSRRSVQWAWSVRVDLRKISPELSRKANPSG